MKSSPSSIRNLHPEDRAATVTRREQLVVLVLHTMDWKSNGDALFFRVWPGWIGQ